MASIPLFRPPYPLDIADSVGGVERRLQSFLNASSPQCVRLSQILSGFTRRFERSAIVGGMVRDFARVGAPGFHSDIDLVIHASAADVQAFAQELGARTNAFGGNSIVIDGWEVDFWALETTWAAREGHVILNSLEDVIRSTFFDHDAILYHLGRMKVICADGYIERQRTSTLEINLAPNPSTHGCLYRAARRILGWELAAGPGIRDFIGGNLDQEAFDWMIGTEMRKKATSIVQTFSSVEDLREALINDPQGRIK